MSLLAPLGLLMGLLSAPLVALYFLKLRRQRVQVPSLMLWGQFQKTERLASPFDRFRRNPLMWLQLLLLLLLTLALSRPYTSDEVTVEASVVLVLDTSASMLASDVRPNRMAQAQERARELVRRLGDQDEAMLVVAGAHTRVPQGFTRDKEQLLSAIDAVQALPAEGALRDGLTLALSMARSRPNVEVVVFSDGGRQELSGIPTGGAGIRYVSIGRSSVNAGIVALDVRQSPISELDRQLFVTIANYGPAPVEGSVSVYLDGKLVGLRAESLPHEEPLSMVFDLPGARSGELRIELESDGDVLPTDNRVETLIATTAKRRVLLVGGDVLTARALARDPRVDLFFESPEDVTAEVAGRYDATLFMGSVPPGMEGQNYAVLGPHSGSAVSLGPERERVSVLGWQRAHPLTRFVEWESVLLSSAREVRDAGLLYPVVDGTVGPLVLAGESRGGRVIQWTFDPRDSDILLRVAWPVSLLNVVGWLTGEDEGTGSARGVATGIPYTMRVPDSVVEADITAEGPDGPVSFSLSDGLLRIQDTTRVGFYEVRAADQQVRFAANLLSPSESNVAPRSELGLSDRPASAVASTANVGRREYWRSLLWLALVVLMVEWFAWHRRRSA